MNYKITKNGWRPDLPDVRDYKFIATASSLPTSIDLRPQDAVPVYDQGQLSACTSNAISAAYAFGLKKQNKQVFTPSRLFIYYNERVMEDTVKQDAGAAIRDGIKTIGVTGVCNESSWPYDITKFKRKPKKACFTAAAKHKAVTYQRVDNSNINNIKGALASGYPIVFGFTVYESFESTTVAKTGIVPLPSKKEQVLGGHAVLAVGYTSDNYLIVRNSWGINWGLNGYFKIPFAYITNTNLSDDWWVVTAVS